jgi:hypothetical protein
VLKVKISRLIKFEIKKFLNGFILSLRKSQYIVGYIIIIITLFFLNKGLSLLIFEANELRQIILDLQIFNSLELFFLIFPLWNIYSVVKGIFSSYFLKFYNLSDAQILFTSPLSFIEIHLIKYLIYFIKHFIFLSIFFFSINPLIYFLKLNINEFFILFFGVLIFYEINFLIEFITFFVFRKYNLKYIMILFIFFILVVIITLNIISIDIKYFNVFLPHLIITNIVKSLIYSSDIFYIYNFIILLIIYVMIIFITFLGNKYYYDDLDFLKYNLNLRTISDFINNFSFNIPYIQNIYLFLIFKDIKIFLRRKGMLFVFELLGNYIVIIFSTIMLDGIINLEIITKKNSILSIYIYVFTFILYLNFMSPFYEIFEYEFKQIWLLYSSNISFKSLLYTKYINIFILNLFYIIPFIIVINIPNILIKYIYIFLLINIMILINVFKYLINSYYYSYEDYNNFSFITNFISVISLFFIIAIYINLIFINYSILLIILILMLAMIITDIEKPISYYIIDLISNIFLTSLIMSLIFGFMFLIGLNILLYKNLILYLSTSLLTIYIFRICTIITERNLLKMEELS